MREEKIQPEIERLDRHTKWALLIVSVLTLAALIGAALVENVFPEWRHHRLEYAKILEEKATDERGRAIAAQFEIGIDQNVVPALAAVDRCIVCHAGLDDPRMTDQPHPFRTHPGTLLLDHPAEQFGCTICHRGQGRATVVADAHGQGEDWLYPLYEKSFLYSSCAKCHDADTVYAMKDPAADDTEALDGGLVARGQELMNTRGCLGCHVLNDVGGNLGPEITYIGDKTRHDFDFSHLAKNGEHSVVLWLQKHFLEPGEVSPGTVMPDLGLTEADAEALTAYVLTLQRPNVPVTYRVARSKELPAPEPPDGEALYGMLCSSCHGADGRASEVPGLRTPALNNVDTLAVASDEYLRFIISSGRSRTAMPAWGPDSESLTYAEIDKIVAHIRSWQAEGADPAKVRAGAGDAALGRAYYHGLCANCHGEQGEGGIGNALNTHTFLGIVSDRFLAETIIEGRPGTAMASWKHLPEQAVNDLLAYIRSWHPEAPSFDAVQQSMAAYSEADNARVGEILYVSNCATCHGPSGEGGIGVALNSKSVLPVLDDEYLYRTIVEGRPTTAMPAWRHLSADQIAAIIVYLRSWNGGTRLELAQAPPRGNSDLGAIHFELACAQCHGAEAEGGVGPQLANPVLLSTASDEVLHYWVAEGRTGTAMRGFLAREQGPVELTSGQISDIVAYLRRLGMHAESSPVVRTGVGNPRLGAELFAGSCVGCHGEQGEGASGPQLHNQTFLATASDGFLAATIVLGREGTPMRSMIHGQEGLGQIAPEQVQDVIAFMRTWDVPEPWKPVRSVAEMSERAIRSGSEKFTRFCAGCHGPNGYGEEDGPEYFAPALNNPEFLQAASDGFLQATIARGRSNTPMRPFGKGAGGIATLDAGAINDIVSFIRSWQEDYLPEGD